MRNLHLITCIIGGTLLHIKMPKESKTFLRPLRAQLTVAAARQCTYFAWYNGELVFVKGPFLTEEQASKSRDVNIFKSLIAPSLTLVDTKILRLKADIFPDTKLGIRKKLIDQGRIAKEKFFFQITEPAFTFTDLPTVEKTTKNAWTEPELCVDWARVEYQGFYACIPYSKKYKDTIYHTDPVAAAQLVLHVVCCWLCGCGGDLAARNFLYDKEKHLVFQVDVDNYAKFDWVLPKTSICSARTNFGAHMTRFLKENAAEMEKQISTVLSNAISLTQKSNPLPAVMLSKIEERTYLKGGSCVDWLVGLLQEDSPKRAAEDQRPSKKQKVENCFKGKADDNFRKPLDPWGYGIKVRVSDLQKSIRLGLHRQALASFFSCFNMPKLFDSPRAKAIRTNAINRLAVIAVEDVGVAHLPLVFHVLREIPKLKKTHNATELAIIVILLAHTRKTRVASHLYHSYAAENTVLAKEKKLQTGAPTGGLEDPRWFGLIDEDPEKVWWAISVQDPKLHKLVFPYWKSVAKNNKRAYLQFALSAIYFERLPSTSERIKRHKESPLKFSGVSNLTSLVNKLERNDFDGEGKYAPMKVSYDMHTPEGRKTIPRSEQKKLFKTEGAAVKRQHGRYYFPDLQYIYLHSKK